MHEPSTLKPPAWPDTSLVQGSPDDGQAGAYFAPFDRRRPGNPASPLDRLVRAMLIVAVFLGGWAMLRVGEINLTISDLLLMAGLTAMLLRGQATTRPFGSLTPFWLIGLGLMLGGLLLGSIANGSVERWLIVGGQYLFAFLLLPMFLSGQQISLARMLPCIFVLGIAASQMIGILAMLMFDNAQTIDLLGKDFLTPNDRLGAMTGEPNSNGAMIAFSLPMLFYSLRERIMPIPVGLVCGAALVWGILASGSFTGFSAAVIATAAYLGVSGFRYLVRGACLGLAGLAIVVLAEVPLPASFEERVAGALSTGNLDQAGTFTGRSLLIKEAWTMLEQNPVIGLGVDRFREVSTHGAPVHELHLLIWNEGGIIAFAGIIILLLTMIAAAFVAISRSRSEGAMLFAAIAVFNIYTFSIPHMYSRTWILPVLLAMATVFGRRSLSASARHEGLPPG